MLWIPITLIAALAQTLRFAVQRRLRLSTLSSAGATYARFVYAGPLIVAGAVGYQMFQSATLPAPTSVFWIYAALGGVAQILATICVVALFALRHFTVGVTLSKTEVMMTALIGFLILGDQVTVGALVAMALGVVAVIVLSKVPLDVSITRSDLFQKATLLGVAAGALFGFCSIMYRGATLTIASDDPFLRATQTLMYVILIQSAVLTVYLAIFEPGQIRKVFQAWRVAIWVGVLSLAGSVGWFTAFALQNAAYVKALGQVEIVFSLLVSVVFFAERLTRREAWGIVLMVISILGLVLAI